MKYTYLGLDVETTGIYPYGENPAGLLEVGLVAFDRNMQPGAHFQSLVASPVAQNHIDKGIDPYVHQMHTKNGLFNDLDHANPADISVDKVQARALEFVATHFGEHKPFMLGSSLTLDRTFLSAEMPLLLDAFHYRSIDATSLVLVCTETLGIDSDQFQVEQPASASQGLRGSAHRVIDDLHRSAYLARRAIALMANHPNPPRGSRPLGREGIVGHKYVAMR